MQKTIKLEYGGLSKNDLLTKLYSSDIQLSESKKITYNKIIAHKYFVRAGFKPAHYNDYIKNCAKFRLVASLDIFYSLLNEFATTIFSSEFFKVSE